LASPFRVNAVSMTTCANVFLLWSALENVCVGRKEARAGALGERKRERCVGRKEVRAGALGERKPHNTSSPRTAG
jgi:hypothetical protein